MRIHLVFLYPPATYMTEVDKDKDKDNAVMLRGVRQHD